MVVLLSCIGLCLIPVLAILLKVKSIVDAEVKTEVTVTAASELIKKQGYVIYVDANGNLIAQDMQVIIKVEGLVTHPQTLLVQYQGELINASEYD